MKLFRALLGAVCVGVVAGGGLPREEPDISDAALAALAEAPLAAGLAAPAALAIAARMTQARHDDAPRPGLSAAAPATPPDRRARR